VISGVAVEKLASKKSTKIKTRQEALQTIFFDDLDIFCPRISTGLSKREFSNSHPLLPTPILLQWYYRPSLRAGYAMDMGRSFLYRNGRLCRRLSRVRLEDVAWRNPQVELSSVASDSCKYRLPSCRGPSHLIYRILDSYWPRLHIVRAMGTLGTSVIYCCTTPYPCR